MCFVVLTISLKYLDARADRLISQIIQPHPSTPIIGTIDKDFVLQSDASHYRVSAAELKTWVTIYFRQWTGRQEFRLNTARINAFLTDLDLDWPAVNVRLSTDPGPLQVSQPARSGQKLNGAKTLANIFVALNSGQSSAQLIFDQIAPELSLEKLQALGINTLLGQGHSNFYGSPAARVHNIKTAAEKFQNIIIPPHQEFSFNSFLGEVTASTGYRAELVIKNHTVTPEFGGGLCQVSTTLFRAAMAAGLPILERHSHSLPVHYYNPQGFDATIYPGVSDLRFSNDSPAPILIQNAIVGASLSFQIFGQADGRQTIIDGPHTYESQPDGSMKTWLKRLVTFPNQPERKDVFYSNYQSPTLFPLIRNPLE